MPSRRTGWGRAYFALVDVIRNVVHLTLDLIATYRQFRPKYISAETLKAEADVVEYEQIPECPNG